MNVYYKLEDIPQFKNSVVTIGSFDGLHRGHLKLLQRIKQLAREYDGEEVVVTFHPHPRSIVFPKDKSLKLLTSLDEKLYLMEKQGVKNVVIVPFTVEFSQQSSREYLEKFIIGKFQAKCLVVGYDHRFGLNREGNFDLLKIYANEGRFELVEIKQEEIEEIIVSSTKIRNAVEDGNIDEANLYLGQPYLISGSVVKGDGIGKSIGFPTANIRLDIKDKLLPPQGIYAAMILYSGKKYDGMLYIGDRPTLESNAYRIEVNIFDFNENIYEQKLFIEVISYIRQDEKFKSMDLLRAKLFEDERAVKIKLNEYKALQIKSNVTIAILNYNGEELLESYLPSVLAGMPEDTELLVIDNNSKDGSVALLKEWYPEINVVELKNNHGFAEGYNLGLEDVKTPYTVLLNSDVKTPTGWLDGIISMLDADVEIGIVQPKIRSIEVETNFEYAGAAGGYIDKLFYPFCRGRIFETVEQDNGQYDDTHNVAWASGCAMVVRTKLFKNLGGFDAMYFAHQEEIDFCLRAQKAGYKCVAYGGSHVYHLGGGTLSYDNPNKIYLNFRNSLMNILKHDTFPRLMVTVGLRLCLDILAGFKFMASGNFKAMLNILKAHVYIHVFLPDILMKRNKYADLIRKYSVGKPRKDGFYNGLIPKSYFINGNKLFSKIKIQN